MNFELIWKKILDNIPDSPQEIQTIPITLNKIGVWFSVNKINSEIYISPAENNNPSSTISSNTRIPRKEFEELLPIYIRRKKGEKVSQEASKKTRFQVYIYAIFKYYGEI